MTRKTEIPNFDNLIQRYLAGESINELASEIGVGYKVLWRRFRKAGIDIRPKRFDLPVDEIVSRYTAGESEQSIARSLGVDRKVIRLRLTEQNIAIRNISDTMYIRWENATAEERQQMLSPAHDAVRGTKRTMIDLKRRALGKQRSKAHASAIEYQLAHWLNDRGIDVVQQKAIGPYNVDIAIEEPRIAIEIFGGNFHATGRHQSRFFKRTKYILDQGWHFVIVWVDGRRYPMSVSCADYIITFANELRSNPSTICKYRVIRGDGNPAPIADTYFNTRAIIKRLCSAD